MLETVNGQSGPEHQQLTLGPAPFRHKQRLPVTCEKSGLCRSKIQMATVQVQWPIDA